MHVLTYGSLMFPPVWSTVVAGRYRSAEAWLDGHRRRAVRGQSYPALVPGAAADRVRGVVYLDVSADDLARLDRFEGAAYARQEVDCALADGGTVRAWVYTVKPEHAGAVTDQDWDPDWFAREGIHQFRAGYQGFDRLDAGPGPAGER